MKLVDEKGRLFGVINVIDFLAILFLLLLTPMFYFGYRIFHSSVSKTKIEEKKKIVDTSIDIWVMFKNLEPEAIKLISAGDKEIDSDGKVIIEILEVSKIEPNFITIKLSENDIVTKEDAKEKTGYFKDAINGRARRKRYTIQRKLC